MEKRMIVDVRIPFRQNKRELGAAYNKAMETVHDWALFLDHDTFLCNPNWYTVCLKAVETLGHEAGMISCRTNAVACPHQVIKEHKGNHDLDYHARVAEQLATAHPGKYTDVTDAQVLLSGFFIMTHKEAWKKVGGFADGFLGVDNDYHKRIRRAGYKVFVMEELYTYHRYKRTWAPSNADVPRN